MSASTRTGEGHSWALCARGPQGGAACIFGPRAPIPRPGFSRNFNVDRLPTSTPVRRQLGNLRALGMTGGEPPLRSRVQHGEPLGSGVAPASSEPFSLPALCEGYRGRSEGPDLSSDPPSTGSLMNLSCGGQEP